MRILTYGATGVQGGAVARRLVRIGHQIRALARHPEQLAALEGVEPALGDLGDRASIEAATRGVDRVVFHLPLVFDHDTGLAYARNVLEAARDAGVRLVVFNTGSLTPPAPTGSLHLDLKREIVELAEAIDQPMIALKPRLYFEVLSEPWVAGGLIANGVLAYPLPADYCASWSALDDVAAIAVACLERTDLAGASIEVGGPQALSGGDLAEIFTKALSRPISYFAIPVPAFEANLQQNFGLQVGTTIAQSFYHFEGLGRNGLAVPQAIETAAKLGVTLTSLSEWIVPREWKA